MKMVDKSIVLQFVKNNRLQYFNEYKAILEEECETLTDDDGSSFLLLQNYPYGLYASFIGFNNDFFASGLAYLEKIAKTVNVAIPMPPDKAPDISDYRDKLIYKGVYKSFAGISSIPVNDKNLVSDSSIRPLTKNDQTIVDSFNEEIHSNMIPLEAAFHDLVVNGNGDLYGYTDKNGNLTGYLSCGPERDG